VSIVTLEDIEENFDLFETWEDRYSYLIDLGGRLPVMDDALKTKERMVKGCVSRVWFDCNISNNEDGAEVFCLVADSDAMIVKGLIYLIMLAYNGKSISEIPNIDIKSSFEKLGLGKHLSPNRRNGFFSMVEYINAYVKECVCKR